MTYDEMLANPLSGGAWRPLFERMASYWLDGTRLGTVELQTRSGSRHDRRLQSELAEIGTAAQVLALIGHEGVSITSQDASGKKLERPDLDVTLADGTTIGVEAAEATTTAQGKHDSETAALLVHVRDLVDGDPGFASALGNQHLSVFLAGPLLDDSRITSKSERRAIGEEIERFIRTGRHIGPKDRGPWFPVEFPMLQRRGATWYTNSSILPYFDIGQGGKNPAQDARAHSALRILDEHRGAAHGYRSITTWMVMLLVHPWEFHGNTLTDIEHMAPPIDPFERCYIADANGRVLEMRKEWTNWQFARVDSPVGTP